MGKEKKEPPGGRDKTPLNPTSGTTYTLRIVFHSGSHLPVADIGANSSDPYVLAQAKTGMVTRHKQDPPVRFRSATARRSTHPKWEAEWILAGVPARGFELKVRVYDEDTGTHDDLLGKVHIHTGALKEGYKFDEHLELSKRGANWRAWGLRTCLKAVDAEARKDATIHVTMEVLGQTKEEVGKVYTLNGFWFQHYSPILGKLVGTTAPEDHVEESNFQANQIQLRGPVPNDLYHRYVEFKSFVSTMFEVRGPAGYALNKLLHRQHEQVYHFDWQTEWGRLPLGEGEGDVVKDGGRIKPFDEKAEVVDEKEMERVGRENHTQGPEGSNNNMGSGGQHGGETHNQSQQNGECNEKAGFEQDQSQGQEPNGQVNGDARDGNSAKQQLDTQQQNGLQNSRQQNIQQHSGQSHSQQHDSQYQSKQQHESKESGQQLGKQDAQARELLRRSSSGKLEICPTDSRMQAAALRFLDMCHWGEGARVFTYVISLDGMFRFTETGPEFGIDMLSKHTMHSNVDIYVAVSGEFYVHRRKDRKKGQHGQQGHAQEQAHDQQQSGQKKGQQGGAHDLDPRSLAQDLFEDASDTDDTPGEHPKPKKGEHAKSKKGDQSQGPSKRDRSDSYDTPPDVRTLRGPDTASASMDPADYELVIDNDSGTYRPDKELLPLLEKWMASQFGGLKVVAKDCGDDEHQKAKKKRGEKKAKLKGNRVYAASSVSSSSDEDDVAHGRAPKSKKERAIGVLENPTKAVKQALHKDG